ncbi:hypothetical protein FHS18_005027 [Paenibacillus phyllosphaerae]|uniref:TadE-like protein n=1 Tax=Paenibacillus phyllosphaerae TaxID=274593 RepID=A0A7W5B1X2_9BACL|nr:pilus assembly protein [Paenibacillus phyllosphaerae]MBB3112925.1 hypothetical protein [Paenibacillus phyllosphaerae]
MAVRIRSWWKDWGREEAGQFSLESSMVYPVIFTVVIAMLMFGMYVYQQAAAYYVASTSAERTAFAWSNSHRDPGSGIAPVGEYDGLYWRVGDDSALQSLFQLGGSGDGAETVVMIGASETPSQEEEETESLPEQKLKNGTAHLPDVYEGEAAYRNRALLRTVSAGFEEELSVPLLEAFGFDSVRTQSRAVIVEPTELMRTVDLVRYYAAKWSNRADASVQRANAAEVLTQKTAAAK